MEGGGGKDDSGGDGRWSGTKVSEEKSRILGASLSGLGLCWGAVFEQVS